MTDLYETLGVARDATRDAVRSAFRSRVRTAHPDAGGSAEAYRALVLARDVLTDGERRARYDRTGDAREAAGPDNLEAGALDMAFREVEAAMRADHPECVAVLDIARQTIREKIETVEHQRAATAAAAERLRALARRFRARLGAENRMRSMTEGRARDLERSVESGDAQLRLLRRAVEILEEHEWECNPVASGASRGRHAIFIEEFKWEFR